MNASDIIKAKQSQILNKAYYQPTIFPGVNGNVSTFVKSTINYYPYSSISSASTSYTSSVNTEYLYLCNPTFTSYELANDVNGGNFMEPVCTADICSNNNNDCNTSVLTWKNTNSTLVYNYAYSTSSTAVSVTSTIIMSGPQPVVCPLINFYQGTSFMGNCDICEALGIETYECCDSK